MPSQPGADEGDVGGPVRKANTTILIVPILLVLITFLFWYQTWFGRKLSDRDMTQYLTDTSRPHETQHALSQLSDRMAAGDRGAERWYPQLLALAVNKESQFRLEAAWAMGQDNHSDEFHQALRKMLQDPAPMVRANAALGLARFGDASGDAELRSMLQPFTLGAPAAGVIKFRMKEKDEVRNGTIIARIRPAGSNQQQDVLSPVGGVIQRLLVPEGGFVVLGSGVAVIDPDDVQVVETLRALYLVGQPEDLGDVDKIASGAAGMPDRVRLQAQATARAIRERQSKGKS